MDDLEGPRVKAGAAAEALRDLEWLGLNWQGEVLYESSRTERYLEALEELGQGGHLYTCTCTRSEIAAAAVGTAEDGAPIYGGACRPNSTRLVDSSAGTGATRFHVTGEPSFVDGFLGPQRRHARDFGDFVVRKADGEFAYQLATVVDDLDAQINFIVRGEDLLASTFRQLYLYEALGRSADVPRFVHLPLVVGKDGRKLAKRHGDTRISQLREEGMTAGRLRAVLAQWSGFEPSEQEIAVAEWVERFDLATLPRHPIVYNDRTDRPGLR